MTPLFAGVMSGTSLDGADAAVLDFSGKPRTLAFATVPFPADLREQLLALSTPGTDGLDAAGDAMNRLAGIYGQAVEAAIAQGRIDRGRIAAIGCHGQTVRHRPERGFTIQINDGARLAELTGINVVADFRRRDVAAGGQGAPIAPAFHDAVFRDPAEARAIVNIGGISNVTYLVPGHGVSGFDCGPGNVLLDTWAQHHLGAAYDDEGAWAAKGRVDEALLERLLATPFLQAPPPKSTGRELFRKGWLDDKLPASSDPADVQATLVEFTARAIAEAIARYCPGAEAVYLCGGGGRNRQLVRRIADCARPRRVQLTDDLGIPTGHVEAAAFAWLAMKCVRREPLDLRTVTGAQGPRILGAIYPA